ncbi:hypothetical protein, partial [Prevotella pallens]
HNTFNVGVMGSSPMRITKQKEDNRNDYPLFVYIPHIYNSIEFLYFLTRAIADAGSKNKSIGVVWLMPFVKLLFAAKCMAIAFIRWQLL